jgi:hypothetical protein
MDRSVSGSEGLARLPGMLDSPFHDRHRTSRRRARRTSRGAAIFALSVGLLLFGRVERAIAQPNGWAAGLQRLEVVNLASGVVRAAFDAPAGVSFGQGALTPDGRFYLLATSQGVLRFRTDSVSLDRTIGTGTAVTQLAIPPTGSRVYAAGAMGLEVIDWDSGALILSRCCDPVLAVQFTPDGRTRLEVTGNFGAYLLTAFVSATGSRLWSVELGYHWVEIAASNTQVAVNTDYSDSRAVLVYGALDGAFQGWLQGVAPNGMAWRGDELLISEIVYVDPPIPSRPRLRLYAVDQALRRRVIADRIPAQQHSFTGAIALSYDQRRAYWVYYDSDDPSDAQHAYDIIDLETNTLVGTGQLGRGIWNLAVEDPDPCVLHAPSTVTAPIEGGLVAIQVTPATTCRPWYVLDRRVLNPGPHVGSTTVLVQTWANPEAATRTEAITIGSQTVLITQPSGVPAAPAFEAAVAGDRVALSWTPAIGAGITAFVVRGAIAGGAVTDVLQVRASLRAWISPPLPPGSYEVELVAANGAGRSASSKRRAFSIGVAGTPDPPSGLTALVADDRVALSWTPAATSPAPAGFVVEAAATGRPAFAPAARTDGPSFVATRVPAGTWEVRVRSATAGGVSEPSVAITVTTAACMAPPGPPQAPWALWTPPSVSVRWSPPATGAVEEYVIEVGRTSGSVDLGRLVVTGARLSVTESVSSLAAFVRIRARNACGESAPSAEIPIVVY